MTEEEAEESPREVFNVNKLSVHVAAAHRLVPRGRKLGDLPTRLPILRTNFDHIASFLAKFDDQYIADMNLYLADEHVSRDAPPGASALQLKRLFDILRRVLSNNALTETSGRPFQDEGELSASVVGTHSEESEDISEAESKAGDDDEIVDRFGD